MLKILIVEDEFISRTLLKEMLAPFGACETAENGSEAVDIIHKSYDDSGRRFDLVCLDIMMPKMNGHQVLKEIRRIENKRGLKGNQTAKILMITALDDTKNIMEALVVGRCEAYMTKPISSTKLEEQLRNLCLIDMES
jgi:two-component system chemotaxis response regulator CheY